MIDASVCTCCSSTSLCRSSCLISACIVRIWLETRDVRASCCSCWSARCWIWISLSTCWSCCSALGEFCYCFLTAPLESAFGNAPLLVLLYEPRRLTVKALDIRRKGGVILPRLFLCLTGTGEQRLDVIFLTGIFGSFARDVGAPGISRTGPDDATDTGTNGGTPAPHQRARLPQPLRRPLPLSLPPCSLQSCAGCLRDQHSLRAAP